MFQIDRIKVVADDITEVEQHFGFSFNDKQKDIINFWGSADIQACPGSGKTTNLAAKLMLLAKKLPKSFQRGVCIITHTNTAVDEIKNKLGSYASFYNVYPHHFGTIQSFVDKFLAIPAFKLHYPDQTVKIIDNESYCKEIDKFISLTKTKNFFSLKGIEQLGSLSFNIENFDIARNINSPKLILNGVKENTMKSHYDRIKDVKKTLLKQGYMKYDEAYSIAFSHIRKNPRLKELFCKRFSIVFIDEMQDMESHQFKLIQELFEGTSTIIQKFGDFNQSIFSSYSNQDKSDWKPKSSLQLTQTMRLPKHLASIVKNICLDPQEMEGKQSKKPLKPIIIVFNDATKDKVKDTFVELIIKHDLLKFWSMERPFKAIGQRMSFVLNDGNLNINSYWDEFNKNVSIVKKEEFENLFLYLVKCNKLLRNKNVKEIRKTLLDAICKALTIAEIRNPIKNHRFTPSSLTKYLSDEKEPESIRLNRYLQKWILDIGNTSNLVIEINDYIKSLVTLLGKYSDPELKYFLTNTDSVSGNNPSEHKIVYEHQGAKIHFDTIHGIKGETHTATLYLETYLKKVYDIGGKILPYIVNPSKPDKACKKRLPFAYVAMSRATHLLCLAVHEDRFKDEVKAYFENINNGWNIEYLIECK